MFEIIKYAEHIQFEYIIRERGIRCEQKVALIGLEGRSYKFRNLNLKSDEILKISIMPRVEKMYIINLLPDDMNCKRLDADT